MFGWCPSNRTVRQYLWGCTQAITSGSCGLTNYSHEQQTRQDAHGEQRRRHLPIGYDHILSPHSPPSSQAWVPPPLHRRSSAPALLAQHITKVSDRRSVGASSTGDPLWPAPARHTAAPGRRACDGPPRLASPDRAATSRTAWITVSCMEMERWEASRLLSPIGGSCRVAHRC